MPRVQAIIVRDGRVLMVRHRWYGEEWGCLPGGAQELGETPAQGALLGRYRKITIKDDEADWFAPGRKGLRAERDVCQSLYRDL
jgi:ADP-ribose pyrophosphatase YjhB (NUDIX family)